MDLLGYSFRSNPAYELVLYDRLPTGERLQLDELRSDPDFYGVLRPREGAQELGIKAVDRETALLFLTLRDAGRLPSYVGIVLGSETVRTIARLVADGVLEVEIEGVFVSGAAVFSGARESPGRGRGRLATLAVEALRYGQALAVDDPLLLSFRLYGYNRRPLTPNWKRRLASPGAVEKHLGIASGGRNRGSLDRFWTPFPPSEAWLSWGSRFPQPSFQEGRVTWKLYVSPAPEALADCFGAILDALAAAGAPSFKIGAGAPGLLRADKLVAYFPSFDRLGAAAAAIASRLDGIPAQGVPFTSEIGGDGLLSWGVDPPEGGSSTSRGGGESWRLWLTHRLARALLAARISGGEGTEPWRFALERLRLEGVDTETWTPGALLGWEI